MRGVAACPASAPNGVRRAISESTGAGPRSRPPPGLLTVSFELGGVQRCAAPQRVGLCAGERISTIGFAASSARGIGGGGTQDASEAVGRVRATLAPCVRRKPAKSLSSFLRPSLNWPIESDPRNVAWHPIGSCVVARLPRCRGRAGRDPRPLAAAKAQAPPDREAPAERWMSGPRADPV